MMIVIVTVILTATISATVIFQYKYFRKSIVNLE